MDSSKGTVVYDLIGVGCGPSNLALAIALDEKKSGLHALKSVFLDKQTEYCWHGNTMTGQSDLQISFLKDLVSLRSPTSPYSFINYLHRHDRLVDFINLGTFYPSRLEFNDYLRWVAQHFSEQCCYGQEVTTIEPVVTGGQVKTVRVWSRDTQGKQSVRETRAVVVSAGGTPKIPDLFQPFLADQRIFHHAQYLPSLAKAAANKSMPLRVAVIGAGQSAAEVFLDLQQQYPSAKVELVIRNFALKPADSSPFVNEIFNPDTTELLFRQPVLQRQRWLHEYRHTNYAAVDTSMIEQIYGIFYRQKVAKTARHVLHNCSVVEQVSTTAQGVQLTLHRLDSGERQVHEYDLVVLATGYQRQTHRELLAPLSRYLGNYEVDRNYRLKTTADFQVPVYLQGYCESSHGLSDTLLSVLAIRSDEISTALLAALGEPAASAVVGKNARRQQLCHQEWPT